MAIENPKHHLTPAQHAELRAAQSPIGAIPEVSRELDQIARRERDLRSRLQSAQRNYEQDSFVPPTIPEDMAREMRAPFEATISETETEIRRDLVALTARAQAIAQQLAEAGEQPSLEDIPADVLDGANRYTTMLAAELEDASLEDIRKQVRAAQIRGDDSVLLALTMVLRPILNDRDRNPRPDDRTDEIWTIRSMLKESGKKFTNRSIDILAERATTIRRSLSDFDNNVLHTRSERTGDTDPYGFLASLPRRRA